MYFLSFFRLLALLAGLFAGWSARCSAMRCREEQLAVREGVHVCVYDGASSLAPRAVYTPKEVGTEVQRISNSTSVPLPSTDGIPSLPGYQSEVVVVVVCMFMPGNPRPGNGVS